MTRNIRTLIAMAVLIIGAAVAFAHNGIEHVIGTVTAVNDKSVTVETIKHTSVTVMVDLSTTTFTHKDLKASMKDLKVGERVVINAKEGPDKKLHSVSVRWGATTSAATNHAEHKE